MDHVARSYQNQQHKALAYYEAKEAFITAVKSIPSLFFVKSETLKV
jgi:hypothetical protein